MFVDTVTEAGLTTLTLYGGVPPVTVIPGTEPPMAHV